MATAGGAGWKQQQQCWLCMFAACARTVLVC